MPKSIDKTKKERHIEASVSVARAAAVLQNVKAAAGEAIQRVEMGHDRVATNHLKCILSTVDVMSAALNKEAHNANDEQIGCRKYALNRLRVSEEKEREILGHRGRYSNGNVHVNRMKEYVNENKQYTNRKKRKSVSPPEKATNKRTCTEFRGVPSLVRFTRCPLLPSELPHGYQFDPLPPPPLNKDYYSPKEALKILFAVDVDGSYRKTQHVHCLS